MLNANREFLELVQIVILVMIASTYVIPLLLTVRGIYLFGQRRTLLGASLVTGGIMGFVLASGLILGYVANWTRW